MHELSLYQTIVYSVDTYLYQILLLDKGPVKAHVVPDDEALVAGQGGGAALGLQGNQVGQLRLRSPAQFVLQHAVRRPGVPGSNTVNLK